MKYLNYIRTNCDSLFAKLGGKLGTVHPEIFKSSALIISIACVCTLLCGMIGEFFTEHVIRVKTEAEYLVYAVKGESKQFVNPIANQHEYRISGDASGWSVVFPNQKDDEQLAVQILDSQTDEILATEQDLGKMVGGIPEIKFLHPCFLERWKAHLCGISRHKTFFGLTIAYIVLAAFLLSYTYGRDEKRQQKRLCLILALCLTSAMYSVLTISLCFAGNPFFISLLTIYVFPFLLSILLFARMNWVGLFIFSLLTILVTLKCRDAWKEESLLRIADYRIDFVTSLAIMHNDGLACYQIKECPETEALRAFLYEKQINGNSSDAKWGYDDSQIEDLKEAGLLTIPKDTKIKGVITMRSYLFWFTAKLWKFLGTNWSVFSALILFIAFCSIVALLLTLQVASGTWGLLVGGLFLLNMDVYLTSIYTNSRNFSVFPASCFIISSAIIGTKYLLIKGKFTCKSIRFYLVYFLTGVIIGFWRNWRPDVTQFFIPVVFLVVGLVFDSRRFVRHKTINLLCCFILVFIAYKSIRTITGSFVGKNKNNIHANFHVALYGEDTRAAVTGHESNCFLYWNDNPTIGFIKNLFSDTDPKKSTYRTAQYDRECFRQYVKSLCLTSNAYWETLPSWGYEVIKELFRNPYHGSNSNKIFFFSLLSVFAVIGCFLYGKMYWTNMAIVLSNVWCFSVLFFVLPMSKHFVTLAPLLILMVATGVKNILSFPMTANKKDILRTCIGLFVCVVLFFSVWLVTCVISNQTVHHIAKQLSKMPPVANNASSISVSQISNVLQLNANPKECDYRRIALRVKVKDVNENSKMIVAFEGVNGEQKLWQGGHYGPTRTYIPESNGDFIAVIPVKSYFYKNGDNDNVRLTLIADNMTVSLTDIQLYNADVFRWGAGLYGFVDGENRIVIRKKRDKINPNNRYLGNLFNQRYRISDSEIELPVIKDYSYNEEIKIIK